MTWGIIQNDSEGVGTWVCDRLGTYWYEGAGEAIGFTFAGKMAAGCIYTDFNGSNIRMGFALEDRRFMNRSTLWAAFAYPFLQLGCRRVTAIVDCANFASLAFVEHLGFAYEATFEDAAPNGDHQIVFRMLASECKWIRNNRFIAKKRTA